MRSSVPNPSVQYSPRSNVYPFNNMDMEMDFEIVDCDVIHDSYEEADTALDVTENFEKLSISSVWSEFSCPAKDKENDGEINQSRVSTNDSSSSCWLLLRFLEDLPLQEPPVFPQDVVTPSDPDFDDKNDLAVYCDDGSHNFPDLPSEEPMDFEPSWGCNPCGTELPEQSMWPDDFKKTVTFPFIFFQPKNRYNQQ
uniref:Ovule protein n=1 Tax=Bursaphelenchus xylophilus TaxID=6326 RepID=A0A1I7SCR0_BURXY